MPSRLHGAMASMPMIWIAVDDACRLASTARANGGRGVAVVEGHAHVTAPAALTVVLQLLGVGGAGSSR